MQSFLKTGKTVNTTPCSPSNGNLTVTTERKRPPQPWVEK